MSGGVGVGVQEHIRFASAMSQRNGKAYVVRFASGGQGTIVEEPVAPRLAEELAEVMRREYLNGLYIVEDDVADLRKHLAGLGVELVLSSTRIPREAIDIVTAVSRALPAAHFGHDHFRILELGGWGHGSAKASEHSGSKVHLFTFATKGPRRNFAGLMLHEIGHAHYDRIAASDPEAVAAMGAAQRTILAHTKNATRASDLMPFAVDYLLGPDSRVQECVIDIREFAAEFYLLYVVRGQTLIDAMRAMPAELSAAWLGMYGAMKRSFGGVEYI
jgi:hypothetical protein